MTILILSDRSDLAETAANMLKKIDSQLAVFSPTDITEADYLKGTWAYVLYIKSSEQGKIPEFTGLVRYKLILHITLCNSSQENDIECKVEMYSELKLLILKFYNDNILNGEHYPICCCCG